MPIKLCLSIQKPKKKKKSQRKTRNTPRKSLRAKKVLGSVLQIKPGGARSLSHDGEFLKLFSGEPSPALPPSLSPSLPPSVRLPAGILFQLLDAGQAKQPVWTRLEGEPGWPFLPKRVSLLPLSLFQSLSLVFIPVIPSKACLLSSSLFLIIPSSCSHQALRHLEKILSLDCPQWTCLHLTDARKLNNLLAMPPLINNVYPHWHKSKNRQLWEKCSHNWYFSCCYMFIHNIYTMWPSFHPHPTHLQKTVRKENGYAFHPLL